MGLLRPQRNPDNGYRLYDSSEVPWLIFVQKAKRLGYTLKEIKEIKHDADEAVSPCPRVREILQKHIIENRQRLDELMALQTRMEQALETWNSMPDGVPDGASVCHLIESVTNLTEPSHDPSMLQQEDEYESDNPGHKKL